MKRNLIGPEIRKARENLGWSREMLAILLAAEDWLTDGVSIEQIENQEAAISDVQILALAKVLEVPLGIFFQSEDAVALRKQIEQTKCQRLN